MIPAPTILVFSERYRSTIIREIMHALGFGNVEQRSDRDDHVIVHIDKVPDHLKYQYTKLPEQFGLSNLISNIGAYSDDTCMHADAELTVSAGKIISLRCGGSYILYSFLTSLCAIGNLFPFNFDLSRPCAGKHYAHLLTSSLNARPVAIVEGQGE